MTMVALAAVVVSACTDKEVTGPDNDSGMSANRAWSVSYAGAGEIDGVSHKHTAAVISSDNNTYTITTLLASEFSLSKLRAFGELLIEDMYSYLNNFNAENGTSYVFADMLDKGSTITALGDLYPGFYVTVAIGITPEGTLSGLYAVSPTFEVKEEDPTALYEEWLGNWVFKGDNNISNKVVISRKIANRQIYLTGLMGLSFSIVGEYSAERNDIIFSAQVVEKEYVFSDGRVGEIHLLGTDRDGLFYGLNNGNYEIAIAGVIENGHRAIVRYGLNLPGYLKFKDMFLVAFIDNEYYSLGEDIPTFTGIAELAPAGASTSSVAPKQLSLGRKVKVVNF